MPDNDPYALNEDDLRRIHFHLLLTPGERLDLLQARVAEWYLKRSQARQFIGRPDPIDLRRPPPGYEMPLDLPSRDP